VPRHLKALQMGMVTSPPSQGAGREGVAPLQVFSLYRCAAGKSIQGIFLVRNPVYAGE